jgi:hypothetical protein
MQQFSSVQGTFTLSCFCLGLSKKGKVMNVLVKSEADDKAKLEIATNLGRGQISRERAHELSNTSTMMWSLVDVPRQCGEILPQ